MAWFVPHWPKNDSGRLTWLSLLISGITLLVYLPALGNGFVGWDDTHYVMDNPHIRALDGDFLRWALLDRSVVYWHPLTWLSHAVDYALWGLKPYGHHLTSTLLHAANTFVVVRLVFQLHQVAAIRQATVLADDDHKSLVVASVTGLLFGLHPLHVESVAWTAERKDVLYAFFYLMSITAYLRYAASELNTKTHSALPLHRQLLLSLVFFSLSLSSKPMAVTLPAILLLLDWFPLRRFSDTRNMSKALLEKLPFFVLSGLVSAITVKAQVAVGAVASLQEVPVATRIAVALRSIVAYLWHIIYPANLLPLYPFPRDAQFFGSGYLAATALVVAITAGCLLSARKKPSLTVIWAFFLVSVLPVSGIIQAGPQAMADRFVYLPAVGPFLLIGAGAGRLWEMVGSEKRQALLTVAVVFMGVFSVLTIRQTRIWENGISLWSYQIEKTRGRSPEAFFLRGASFEASGDVDRALRDYDAAIMIDPGYVAAYSGRGLLLLERGLTAKAISDFNTAIRLNPSFHDAYTNRGNALFKQGDLEGAVRDYDRSLEVQQAYQTYFNRGNIHKLRGDLRRAIDDYSMAVSLNSGFAPGYVSRGDLYVASGDMDRGMADYRKACQLGNSVGCTRAKFPLSGIIPQNFK